ncbi:MAG: iron-transfer P-loop NTPase [Fibrobacterota bacterium]
MNIGNALEQSNEALLLATKILGQAPERIVVTSCEDGAGKTTLCKLLATVAIERLNRPVVLLDLNLRHPSEPSAFTHLLTSPLFELRAPGAGFENLHGWEKRQILSDLFGLSSPERLLIVDTSPLGIFNRNNIHPVQLSEWSNEFVLVVAQEKSRLGSIREAKNLLLSHGIKISGAVLNQHGNPEAPDTASVTGWRTLYRRTSRARTELPRLFGRLKSVFHALRIVWRLERPGIRKAFNRFMGLAPVASFLAWARRVDPVGISEIRRFLSWIRSSIDSVLGKGDRRWTRN